MKYNTFTLANGLRVIQLPSDSPVVYCGYQMDAGSRDELPGDEGLAHFCEHTTFKGTRRRRAYQILNCLESVGGELNAYTNKEDTVYYAAILRHDVPRAVDLLTDMVFHSTYPQAEIDKEVEVICDEIESYNDSPAELIFDEFENQVFQGHPLGHNILGSSDRVRQFTTADALRFTGRLYRPDTAVFFMYGGGDRPARLRALLEKAFAREPLRCVARPEAPSLAMTPQDDPLAGSSTLVDRGTHQAHVVVGCRAYGRGDHRRHALYLLNNILGGPGMNARLNVSLRERNGLVYTVESSMACYDDTGLWCTYLGCDPKDVRRCLRLLRRELDRLADRLLTPRQLHAAKKQLLGQIGVASDQRESFALSFGKNFLHGHVETRPEDIQAHVEAVSAEEVRQVAGELFAPVHLQRLVYR